ncbi:hypothetical protein [Mucilaginibacter sp. SP1R1]|uniref:hypothetical protein n=1 Tax=Mucilaginibacter sp. SP1R1 TaxID=2723091 RepID=UPI003AFFF71E
MQPDFDLTAHKLAKILLMGEDFPVVIPSSQDKNKGEFIKSIFILQNQNSPFEYSILLEGQSAVGEIGTIDIED